MIGAALVCSAFAIMACAADDAPAWLREFSTTKAPAYETKVPAVVLLDEESVTVDDSGRVTTTNRKAIRILTKEGRKEAVAHQVYIMSTGKVRDLRAWLIRPSGEVKKYGKNEVADVALAPNDVYNEVRVRALVASNDVDPGAVFGYEAVSEDRSVFTQFEFSFQRRLPSLLSRFALTLPAAGAPKARYSTAKLRPSNPAPPTPGNTVTSHSLTRSPPASLWIPSFPGWR
jgi:hypothetical protein